MNTYVLLPMNLSWFNLVIIILMIFGGQTAFLYFGEKQRKKMKGNPFIGGFITLLYRLFAAAFSTAAFYLLLFEILCNRILHITAIEQTATNAFALAILWFLFVVVSCTAILRLMFNDSRDFPAIVHILMGEYLLCSQSKDNKHQMVEWIVAVNAELKRFGLMNTQVGKLVKDIKIDAYSTFADTENQKKDEKNLYTEENLQKVASILLVMAGSKESVPDFKFHEPKE